MKNTIKIAAFVLALFSLSSCEKYFGDINDNPNDPQTVTPGVMLSSAQAHLAYGVGGDLSRYTGVWMQQLNGAGIQWLSINNYSVLAGDFDNVWRFNLYGGPLNDLYILNKESEAKGYWTYAGIAKVMLAYGMSVTTDCWGDVPFSEAFQGEGNESPGFDTQQEVYNQLLVMLDSAIAELGNASPGDVVPSYEDMIYGGDVALWTKAAYTLKARLYLHLGLVDPANYTNALNALGAGGVNGFASNADDFQYVFGTTETAAAPWYQFDRDRPGDIEITGYMIDTMTAMGDPRLPVFATATSGIGPFFGSSNSPVIFVSYAEQKFIEAEAAFQTNDKARAANAYNEAIALSLSKFDVTDASYLSVYANENSASITMDKIMLQKYIALFTNPEVWTDWRRTGIPALQPYPANVTGDIIPVRMVYPLTEQQYNPNTPPGSTLTTRLWWDTN